MSSSFVWIGLFVNVFPSHVVGRYNCFRRPTFVARQLFDRTPLQGSKDEAAVWTPSGPDGISALPDDVIHHVLGFLPAHDALQTSVLARRWRNHWMSMHSLRFAAVSGSVSVEEISGPPVAGHPCAS